MSPVPGASPWRPLASTLVKVAVSVLLLALLFSRVDASRLWGVARAASPLWLASALGLYLTMILVSAWRWGLLLAAQQVALPFARLTSSFFVATFFNNFLPSNIGGDVVRIADTAPAAGSKTLATTVVLIDRGIGLLGLVFVAALGATFGAAAAASAGVDLGPVGPGMLWFGFVAGAVLATPALLMPEGFARMLRPLRVFHAEWIDVRIARLTGALTRFRETPAALAGCFAGAVVVQAVLVVFYAAVARSMHIPVGLADLALVVPITFIVQMLPISLNGFGIREATFGYYFTRLGLPLESALLVSFVGAAVVLFFSLSGGVVHLLRRKVVVSEAAEHA